MPALNGTYPAILMADSAEPAMPLLAGTYADSSVALADSTSHLAMPVVQSEDPAMTIADSTTCDVAVPASVCTVNYTAMPLPVRPTNQAMPMVSSTSADSAIEMMVLPSSDSAMLPVSGIHGALATVLRACVPELSSSAVTSTNLALPKTDFTSICPTKPPSYTTMETLVTMVESTASGQVACSSSVDPEVKGLASVRHKSSSCLESRQWGPNMKTMHSETSLLYRLRGKSPRNTDKQKRKSKYINSQPLYQEYWSQCTGMDPRPGMACFQVERSFCMAGLVPYTLMSPPQMSPRDSAFSFWQEIPQVKESGLLKRISLQERRLQEAVFEVVTSEASYLRSLSVAVNHFERSCKLTQCLRATEVHALFSNLQQVKDVSERFLLELEEQLEGDVFLRGVGEIVLKHCPSFHKVYVPYVTNQMYQERLMQQLMHGNLKFQHVLQKLEQQPLCQRQTLKSFLVLPFQRITRLKILMENVLKLSLVGSVMALSVGKALKAVSQIVWECNESIGRMKQTEELVLLEKQVQFLTTRSIPLISRGRWLLRQGALSQILLQESSLGQRPRLSTRPVYLHLFCDLLLLSRTEHDLFLVEDYANPSDVKAEHFKAKALGLPSTAFLLCLLRNHTGSNCNLILDAANEDAKQEWVSLLSSQMGSRAPSMEAGAGCLPKHH
ncbi:rho guanine nucleotide exchange factor 19-like [Ambystoma mexicanum]|uniref:rho guanine nucleotide exchange factor 19-like n=1 Tax=Ambystoma mexicanum TaxID=8296 RepID=UPI0037E95CCD